MFREIIIQVLVIGYYGSVIGYSWVKFTSELKIESFVVGVTGYAFAVTGYHY